MVACNPVEPSPGTPAQPTSTTAPAPVSTTADILVATTAPIPSTTTTAASTTSSTPGTTSTTPPATTTTVFPPGFTASVRTVGEAELGHSWHSGCPVAPTDLRSVGVTYVDFSGAGRQGQIVVHRDHADQVISVFAKLFAGRYPIESMIPISALPEDAEDQPDYANTSGFHCRFVDGTERWSEHAYGRAIDINPHLNPLVRGDYVWPEGAVRYVDRTLGEPGMIVEGDLVVSAFDSIGWGWGGRWTTLKDYHHFSSSGR